LPYSSGQAARARGDREESCPFHNGPVGAEQRVYWLAGFRGQLCPTEEEVRRISGGESCQKTMTAPSVCSATDQSKSSETFALSAKEKTNKRPSKPTPTGPRSKKTPPTSWTPAAKADTSKLSAAHHEAAKVWDDATLCLEWAAEQEASVKEMIAWRNLQKSST